MKLLSSACLVLLKSSNAFSASKASVATARSFHSSTAIMSKPFSVIVEAEIQADRMDEFMSMIKTNAEESRKEPGCIRFDVLRDQGNANKFWFYEVYKDTAAVDFHKTQAHYQAWADFKESGGTVSSVSNKADGEFIG